MIYIVWKIIYFIRKFLIEIVILDHPSLIGFEMKSKDPNKINSLDKIKNDLKTLLHMGTVVNLELKRSVK